MSIEGLPASEESSSWEVVRREFDRGVAVSFIGRHAVKRCDASEVRAKVHDVLMAAGVDDERVNDAEFVVGELSQNAWRHGVDHEIVEVDVVVTPGEKSGHNGEVVDISVVNRAPRSSVRENGTIEGMAVRGENGDIESDVDDPELLFAEHGYGLRAVVHEFTGGNWGYDIIDGEERDEVQVVTFATLAALGKSGLTRTRLDKAA